MNAVTRTGGEEHYMDVQNQVLSGVITKEGVPEERLYAFIMDNGPLFRFFATHLPDELSEHWDVANTDEVSRAKLDAQYKDLRARVKQIFEQRLDADTQTALSDAAENGDIATAERILEAHIALMGRIEE